MRSTYLYAFVFLSVVCFGIVLCFPVPVEASGYMGHQAKKGCTKCHGKQFKSWQDTSHGKAMESLKPGVKKEAKTKAKLDPDKDYTQDKDCLKCHTTGYSKGGYSPGNNVKMENFSNVGCESCHGGGKDYMDVKKKYRKKLIPRQEMIDAGMLYGEKEVCEKCHNNDSPFNAELDKKYALDYKKVLKKATHEHKKLKKLPIRKGSEWLYE